MKTFIFVIAFLLASIPGALAGSPLLWGPSGSLLLQDYLCFPSGKCISGGFDPASPNQIFAGPVAGSPATPSFRLLDASDIPSLASSTISFTPSIANNWLDSPANVNDALNSLAASSYGFTNIIPQDAAVLPISAARAYFQKILYSPTAIFKDGSATHKYVAYYGNGTNSSVAYSDDGTTWGNEATVTGIAASGYHASIILVGTTIHMFYWNGATLYSPSDNLHATFDITADCSAATANTPLSGSYVTGVSGNLRYGSYGVYEAFYNASPTNDPSNPYSYQWCIIHGGTTGAIEGILFAVSTDGFEFNAWNGLTEVISRNPYPSWDVNIGPLSVWKVGATWHAFFSAGVGTNNGADTNMGDGIGYATSSDGITWAKAASNPIINKNFALKASKRLYCPSVIKDDNGWRLYYSAKNNAGVYKVYRAFINVLK